GGGRVPPPSIDLGPDPVPLELFPRRGILPPVFIDFFYELRRRGIKVGPQEALAVAEALTRDLHETTLDGFYDVARALCVHREQALAAFDTAFAAYFHGIEVEALQISEELLDWLKQAAPRRELTDEERALLESLDLQEARRRLQERLRE